MRLPYRFDSLYLHGMEQLKMIDKVRGQALADERVSAVLMYGSFTSGEGDRYSDIEFYVFLREESGFDKLEWLNGIRPVEMLFTNEFGTDVAVFDNLVRGEFHFHSISETGIIHTWEGALDFRRRDKMSLVDKDGKLADELDAVIGITPDWNTPENAAWVADSLINQLLFTGNVIRRGEYARAAHLFYFIEKYLAQLIRLQFNTTEHWLDPMKGFEKEIPLDWYVKLSGCLPRLNPDSLRDCFFQALALAGELFELLDVPAHNKLILEKIPR